MKIRSVEFVGAIAQPNGPAPETELPEIAFSGRSNVGKSSLINRLLGRTRTPVARVSGTPGKTREVNFYRVDALPSDGSDALLFHLVDLPGYGYARVPRDQLGAWKPLVEGFLAGSRGLRGVVQLVDARHGPTRDDRQMLEYLTGLGTPILVVLTKVDKLKAGQRKEKFRSIAGELALDMEQIVPFSAVSGEGRDALIEAVEALLQDGG